METKSIMIVGVGGQGSLLASKLLGALLTNEGYDVKVSGDKVYSPVISKGEADYIVSFERLEAARYVDCLKKDGKIIVNSQTIDPMPVITGAAEYPFDVLDELKSKGVFVDEIDALSLAEDAGTTKAVNIVLMGRLAKYFHIDCEKWIEAIKSTVKPQFVDVNLKAFKNGYNL